MARVGDSDAAGSNRPIRPIARAAGSDRESGTRREARIDSAFGEIPPDIFGQAFAVDISARTRGGRRARGVSAARAAAAAVKAATTLRAGDFAPVPRPYARLHGKSPGAFFVFY